MGGKGCRDENKNAPKWLLIHSSIHSFIIRAVELFADTIESAKNSRLSEMSAQSVYLFAENICVTLLVLFVAIIIIIMRK